MDYQTNHVMTLTNSIIGVSILAMPYCFKQCGIILSTLMLLISSIISRLSCHFLLKSAIIARRKTFEFLAFHIFGALGKFVIEIGLIGFLVGTCIAFFVVMGDLGPEIISEITEVRTNSTMRTSVLIILAAFCVLPLGLLRNVDSLSAVSKATVGFYCCLVLKIIVEAMPHIFSGDWMDDVVLWRPVGILQCLPIFSMALSCQTQLFEIYQVLPNTSLEKMNSLIKMAVNICTWVYIFVGIFGYIAFFKKPFTGNILLSFQPSIMTDVMKIGFVLSLAFSFPLVILPCRASLYSLLYKGTSYTLYEGSTNYIPEGKFKLLTFAIVFTSLVIGIIIPNIELVLGLVGSTIGVMICVLFPVTCFICIIPKNTNERVLAQIMLFIGVIVMVLGTYANLYAFEEAKLNSITEKYESLNNAKVVINNVQDVLFINEVKGNENRNVMEMPTTIKQIKTVVQIDQKQIQELPSVDKEKNNISNNEQKLLEGLKEVRHEPPQPEEPVESQVSLKPKENVELPKEIVDIVADNSNKNTEKPVLQNKLTKKVLIVPVMQVVNKPQELVSVESVNSIINNDEKIVLDSLNNVEPIKDNLNHLEEVEIINENKENGKKPVELVVEKEMKENAKKTADEVDIEAIKKEEKELKEQEKDSVLQNQDTNQVLIDTIQKQNEVQKEIVEQHKKLIEVIQKQQENSNNNNNNNNNNIDKFKEEQLKAVKQIESIAKRAIESISNQDNKKNIENVEVNHNEIVKEVENKIKNVDNAMKSNLLPAPLSYQLGLNQEKVESNLDNKQNNINLVPLPIAMAKNLSMFDAVNKNISVKNEKIEVKSIKIVGDNQVQKSADLMNNEAKEEEVVGNTRRDILSQNKSSVLIREKREANDLSSNKSTLNKNALQICKEVSKSTSTIKPFILCKLSEPKLVSINLNELGVGNIIPIKSQERELKLDEKLLREIY